MIKKANILASIDAYPPFKSVLQDDFEYQNAISLLNSFNLPLHCDSPKNWDSLAALATILRETNTRDKILDAGGECYSVILPQLALLGYKELKCMNISFREKIIRNGISYEPGDITNTNYPENFFSAISCLSVVEHGIMLENFFKEAFRILKVKGMLIISTDYWHEPIDTKGQKAFDTFIKIFDKDAIEDMINIARRYNFNLDSTLDLTCKNKVVTWSRYDLNYTFIHFIFRKTQISCSNGVVSARSGCS